MITNLRLETSDEERERIAETLGLEYKLAKRDDIKEAINEYVQNVLIGGHQDPPDTGRHRGDRDDDGSAGDQGLPDNGDPEPTGFKPSRGDEPYLYKPRSVALKDACSAMLDQAEIVEQLVWDVLEKNRDK